MAKQFTKEFKDSSIQLALNSESSVTKVAKDLGMPERTLQGWVQHYREENNIEDKSKFAKKKMPKLSLEEENQRLKKENENLKKDAEILKKAAAYFARETL